MNHPTKTYVVAIYNKNIIIQLPYQTASQPPSLADRAESSTHVTSVVFRRRNTVHVQPLHFSTPHNLVSHLILLITHKNSKLSHESVLKNKKVVKGIHRKWISMVLFFTRRTLWNRRSKVRTNYCTCFGIGLFVVKTTMIRRLQCGGCNGTCFELFQRFRGFICVEIKFFCSSVCCLECVLNFIVWFSCSCWYSGMHLRPLMRHW